MALLNNFLLRLSRALASVRNGFRLLVALGVILLGWTTSAQVFREYDLKALFLYNFAPFVEWPATAFESSDAPLVLGVVGPDRFGKSLTDLTRSESVRRRRMTVERYRKVADIQTCQILFIDQSQSQSLKQILDKVRGKPVLTVSDMPGFANRSGMIQFVTEEDRIRLRINVTAAKAANLTISSKLLKLAEIVE